LLPAFLGNHTTRILHPLFVHAAHVHAHHQPHSSQIMHNTFGVLACCTSSSAVHTRDCMHARMPCMHRALVPSSAQTPCFSQTMAHSSVRSRQLSINEFCLKPCTLQPWQPTKAQSVRACCHAACHGTTCLHFSLLTTASSAALLVLVLDCQNCNYTTCRSVFFCHAQPSLQLLCKQALCCHHPPAEQRHTFRDQMRGIPSVLICFSVQCMQRVSSTH
jgi:hypothetical protein